MSELKSNILTALYTDAGAAVSGGKLAGQFGVSRTAVWKAVEKLSAEGYKIERVNRGGYRFTGDGGVLSAEIIKAHLTTESLGRNIEILDETDSTDYYIKRGLPKPAGYTVLTDRQHAGHGRFDRTFHSPAGGLYMSFLLKPSIPAEGARLLTVCAAATVCRALKTVCGFDAGIKWVNDIYYGGKKLCGISTDAAVVPEAGYLEYAIVGIGINLNETPETIKDIAVSVFDITQKTGFRNLLAAEILNAFERLLQKLSERGGQNEILAEYRERLFIIGKKVTVRTIAAGEYEAVVTDLAPDGALLVTDQAGTEQVLNAGEVSLKVIDN